MSGKTSESKSKNLALAKHKYQEILQSLKKNRWPKLFPYPSSILRAVILVPIAFPGAKMMVFGIGGVFLSLITSSNGLLIASIFGLLISTIFLSLIYHFCWFFWRQKLSLKTWYRWLPNSSSLYQGFYGAVVTGLSFVIILCIWGLLSLLICRFFNDSIDTITQCSLNFIIKAEKIISYQANNFNDFNGGGVIIKTRKSFYLRLWFIIWLIIASYLYQAEYILYNRLFPQIKLAIKNYGLKKIARNLIIISLAPITTFGIYLSVQMQPFISDIVSSNQSNLSPQAIVEKPQNSSPQEIPNKLSSESSVTEPNQKKVTVAQTNIQPVGSDNIPFQEAINYGTNAANLTQTAKSIEEWNQVKDDWQKAINLMNEVPESDPNYLVAQNRVIQYQNNFNYAQKVTEKQASQQTVKERFFQEGINEATTAAFLVQKAKTKDEWEYISTIWEKAIEYMKAVQPSDPNYQAAQDRVIQYKKNLEYASLAASRPQ
ncbi:MAG: hypothetical protein WBA93_26400 [Microcoleaceae cyanobacterium]